MGAVLQRDTTLVLVAVVGGLLGAAGAIALARAHVRPDTHRSSNAPTVASDAPPAPGAASDAGAGADATSTPYQAPTWAPTSRAAVYGALGGPACEKELRGRAIPYAPASAQGVESPVRLTGPLHGVSFRAPGPARQRGPSVFEIADCRLVLALDDLAAKLAARGIVAVDHFSMHRPEPPPPPPPRRGQRPPPAPASNRSSGRPSQHVLGLAIDIGAFTKADGTKLIVKTDWHGALGDAPCTSPPREPTAEALELRAIVCDASESGLFNVILTPDANTDHADHVHMDITRDARWFLLE